MFSGGTYDEVARWLRNFLASHAKREDPRIEVELETDGEREGVSYAARLRLHARWSARIELEYHEVADNRGSLAWAEALARRTRVLAAGLAASRDAVEVSSR